MITCTLATVAVTGKLTRWLSASPPAAAAAGFGAPAADLALLALLESPLTRAPGTLDALPVAAAAAASLTRLALARRAIRSCLAPRTTLTCETVARKMGGCRRRRSDGLPP